jgi:hypothetical protein
MRPFAVSFTLLLLGLAACKPPVPAAEAHEQALEAAARTASETVPSSPRADFIQGFRMGAHMVWEASRRHRTPWLPVLGQPAPPRLPEALRTLGAKIEPPRPRYEVEVDPATGVPIFELDAQQGGSNRGEVAGFAWALAPERSRLCHLETPPALPKADAWEAWNPAGLVLWNTETPSLQVRVAWTGNVLFWSWMDHGFPRQRSWRAMPDGFTLEAAALQDRCLWVATPQDGCFALALDSGFIVAVHPQTLAPGDIHHTLTGTDWKAQLKRQEAREQEAANRAKPLWLEQAAHRNTQAMLALAYHADSDQASTTWFRKAAEAGDAQGMYEFAIRLYQGRGIAQDKTQAHQWFEKAAEAGQSQAREVLKGLFSRP